MLQSSPSRLLSSSYWIALRSRSSAWARLKGSAFRYSSVSFNQDRAMRIVRFRQLTQCGRAWPEPMHFSSRNSAVSHDNIINLPSQRCLSGRGLTLIARRSGFIDPLLELVEVALLGRRSLPRTSRRTSQQWRSATPKPTIPGNARGPRMRANKHQTNNVMLRYLLGRKRNI